MDKMLSPSDLIGLDTSENPIIINADSVCYNDLRLAKGNRVMSKEYVTFVREHFTNVLIPTSSVRFAIESPSLGRISIDDLQDEEYVLGFLPDVIDHQGTPPCFLSTEGVFSLIQWKKKVQVYVIYPYNQ